MENDDAQSTVGAVKNWVLLETELKNVFKDNNWQLRDNNVGDACIFPEENGNRELNITQLARTLSPRVLVRIAPLSAEDDA